jgi:hypothetical protein
MVSSRKLAIENCKPVPYFVRKSGKDDNIVYPVCTTIAALFYELYFYMLKYTGTTPYHRYLMTRLSLKVVYLWRHVSSTAPPFILWWWNLKILFAPLNRSSPFIGELRCQAIQMEHALIQQRGPKAQSILWDVSAPYQYIWRIQFAQLMPRRIL